MNKQKKGNDNKQKNNDKIMAIISAIIAVIILYTIYGLLFKNNDENIREKLEKEYTYSQFMQDLEDDKVSKIAGIANSKTMDIVLKTEEQIAKENEIRKEHENNKVETKKALEKYNIDLEEARRKKAKEEFLNPSNLFKSKEEKKEQEKEYKKTNKKLYIPTMDAFSKFVGEKITEGKNVIYNVADIPQAGKMIKSIIGLIPSILIIAMMYMIYKMQDIGSKSKQSSDDLARDTDIKFDDVAGLDEEKDQLMEIVDFLKEPEKYENMGAKIPRGILLYGDPGTGKTLIAKAIAGEADVPFISMSGSEFIEMFAGLGAQRVRRLFERARKIAPCIIFIDEIDAIGARRAANSNESENNQTLNQLLVEMDGFNTGDNVIVLAATNRPEMLDKALLRPGRFDRQIIIPTPDSKGREEILKIHAKNKKFAKDFSFAELAKDTAGFSGAELANLLNEAAILATKSRNEYITKVNLDEAYRKVVIGLEKQNRVISEKERRITAYHESGHAIVSYMLETQDDVKEVTIVPRGVAGGYTMYKQQEDKQYITQRELEEQMISLLGGRAAEYIIFTDVTTGASNDLERASQIARAMIVTYGMSKTLGPVSLKVEEPYELNYYGEEIFKNIGNEVRKRVEDAYDVARKILTDNIERLHYLAEELLEKERIDEHEFERIMNTDINKLDNNYDNENDNKN